MLVSGFKQPVGQFSQQRSFPQRVRRTWHASVNALLPRDAIWILHTALQFWQSPFVSHIISRAVSSVPRKADSPLWKAVWSEVWFVVRFWLDFFTTPWQTTSDWLRWWVSLFFFLIIVLIFRVYTFLMLNYLKHTEDNKHTCNHHPQI